MVHAAVLILAMALQVRAPETLRAPATPPPDGTGKFQDYAYTFQRATPYFVIEFTPHLPNKRALLLDAMKSVCRDLYDLDFTKAQAEPAPSPGEWRFALKDLRTCYARQMPNAENAHEVKTLRVWMPQ
jgi:hypothetical protein